MSQPAQLWIVGVSLSDPLVAPQAHQLIAKADVLIGESRRSAMPLLKAGGAQAKPVFFLDGMKPADARLMEEALSEVARRGGSVVLFSDSGMPILFDPGKEILELCRQLSFQVRSIPGPTSWGTAMAISGFEPPFLVIGFPPQKTQDRLACFESLRGAREHIVLMDTPYRFLLLLEDSSRAFGDRHAFLAWEVAREGETYLWGSLREIAANAGFKGWKKGEFVLIIRGARGRRWV